MLWPKSSSGAPTAPERPALAVTAGKASIRPLRSVVQASGAIAAWQEGSIGARISGLPVVAVDVNVGDVVKKGQVLARLDDAVVLTEMRQAEANLAAAQAAARQAAANRDRALTLKATGALSDQDILQSTTLAATGEAQVAQARAALEATQLKLRYTRLIAPDDGVISSRTAALGLISQSGTELFRFIRQGRLEWRAELTASQVTQVQPGQGAELQLPDGHAVTGRVRQLSPQLSQDTRLALAYVDLDAASVISSGARAGMYGSGEIRLGMNDAITVPAESVVIRDGRSYVTRRVTAIQHGQAIFSLMVSFHADEESAFDHQEPMPQVPTPDRLTAEEVAKQPMFKEMPDFIRRYYESDRPIELRPVELGRYFGQKIDDGRIHIWIRTAAKLPDDPALHMCALAYASDFSLLDAAMARYGRTLFDKRMMPASLDHAMWFHRPFRADEWLLYAQDSPSAQRGRGLTRGLIFRQDGTLVASVAQEGSLRQRREKPRE